MGFRYIGSKDKLAEIIISEIRSLDVDVTRVIDLMAGTGLFSRALRESGYKVTAVDVMTYSYHHLSVFLLLNGPPEFANLTVVPTETKQPSLFDRPKYNSLLTYLNALSPQEGYFFKEFGPMGTPQNASKPRQYFSAENAAKIDAIRTEIKNLREGNKISSVEHSLLLHDLILAVNDIANIAGTYGHFLSKFIDRANDPIVLQPTIFLQDEILMGT